MREMTDYVLETLRERAGIDPDDTSKDTRFGRMTPIERLREVLGWELGDPSWADTVVGWAEECGMIVDREGTR